MSSLVCERCEREAGVSFVCDNCHRHVCRSCIVFQTFMNPVPLGVVPRIKDADIENTQLCIDCAYPKEGVRINDEPELVPA